VTRRLALALAFCVALAPASALASSTQESMFQDDDLLEFSPPSKVTDTLNTLRALGVDRVRVTVFWGAVAPDASSQTKPKGFDGSDPDAYENARWERYDTLVRLASARGIGVMFDVAGPAPKWATPNPKKRPDLDSTYNPSPSEFNAFVRAVADRYSGSFLAKDDRPKTVNHPGSGVPGTPLYKPPYTTTTKAGPPLPRVDWWEIWNEPNQAGWLDPQWTQHGARGHRAWVPTSPILYRGLADAMWDALQSTGHGSDTILLGVTAPKGLNVKGVSRAIKPLQFITELYCVDRYNQVYRGRAAAVRGCPTKDPLTTFPAQHPVLFKATGYSHHPYELTFAPNRKPTDPLYLTIANLPKLSDTLRRAWLRYAQPVPAHGVPLYLTEFGYQTNPPDQLGVSPNRQASYLDQAEYIAWRNPAVRTLSQFLLVDGGQPIGLTFQSGLRYINGVNKPAFAAYKLPIWVPHPHTGRGHRMRVWALVRPAPDGQAPTVQIQFRARGSRKWRTIGTRTGSAARGYVWTTVLARGHGSVRIVWSGQASRSVGVG
jgi:hypothetical protein